MKEDYWRSAHIAPYKRSSRHGRCSLITILVSVVSVVLFERAPVVAAYDGDLIWFDEFNGAALDTDKWAYDVGDGCDVDICQWGNLEQQWYRKDNAVVSGGLLTLTAKVEEYSSRQYTSARLKTVLRADFTYGRIEARIQLPSPAAGLWPAFWMYPTNLTYGKYAASGEIDIMQSRNNMTEVKNSIQYGASSPSQVVSECITMYNSTWYQGYHVFAVEWSADSMVWYVDDDVMCNRTGWYSISGSEDQRYPQPAPFDQAFHILLDVAIGGPYAGNATNDAALPASMVVDYVRVYQASDVRKAPESIYKKQPTGSGIKQGVLYWSDEFTGTSLNDTNWAAINGSFCPSTASDICTSENQTYSDANVAVVSGNLTITASEASDGSFTSGLVSSFGKFSVAHGRVEASMTLPAGSGVVPSLYLLPTTGSWPSAGQINVVAAEAGDGVTGGVYYGTSDTSPTTVSCSSDLFSADYNTSSHVYAVEWNADLLRWYVDDVQYCEAFRDTAGGVSWPFDGEFYLLVGVALDRDTEGNKVKTDSSALPASLTVDYVRVWKFANDLPAPQSIYVTNGTLILQDEFDGNSLDTSIWGYEDGDGCGTAAGCGNGNLEAQYYSSGNTAVSNGNLVITARYGYYKGSMWTSSKLSTKGLADFQRGRFETRVKVPSGQGLWPAFWMLPVSSPYGSWAATGEIDIMEMRNYMEKQIGQLHFGGASPLQDSLNYYEGGNCWNEDVEDFSLDYHVYALEWEEGAMRWYVDDRLYCDRKYWYSMIANGTRYEVPAPFDQRFYLLFTLAVGGTFTGGNLDPSIFPKELLVDYVRVYSIDGGTAGPYVKPTGGGGHKGGSSISGVTVGIVIACIVGAVLFCAVGATMRQKWMQRKAQPGAAAATWPSRFKRGGASDGVQTPSTTEPAMGPAAANGRAVNGGAANGGLASAHGSPPATTGLLDTGAAV